MKGYSRNWTRFRLLAVVFCLAFSLALVGCNDDTTGNGGNNEIIPPDPDAGDGDGDEEDVEEGYEAGPLDGQWELTWEDTEEKFSDFNIEHNLDENRLQVTFDTVDEGEGVLGSASWDNDRFRGSWEPYPDAQGNEVFTISGAEFVDDSEDRLEGRIAGVTFNIRDFVMERVLD